MEHIKYINFNSAQNQLRCVMMERIS